MSFYAATRAGGLTVFRPFLSKRNLGTVSAQFTIGAKLHASCATGRTAREAPTGAAPGRRGAGAGGGSEGVGGLLTEARLAGRLVRVSSGWATVAGSRKLKESFSTL